MRAAMVGLLSLLLSCFRAGEARLPEGVEVEGLVFRGGEEDVEIGMPGRLCGGEGAGRGAMLGLMERRGV